MPKFPTYERQQGLRGGSTASYASEGAFTAPARALANMGGAVADIGTDIRAGEQKIRNTQSDAWLSKARAETALEAQGIEMELQKTATEGAKDFTPTARAKYEELRKAKLAQAPSPRAAEAYQAWSDSFGVDVVGRAARFQAESELAKRTSDFAAAMNAHAQVIYADPSQYEVVAKRAMDDFAGAKQWMTPEQETAAREKVDHDLKLARAKSLVEFSPADFMAEITAPAAPGNIIDAMISVESTGNAGAVSSKGALGLMQVMPGTAAEIAQELGDRNFPRTPEAQAAYLKNPDVSRAYGQHYFEKMLSRYDGDVDAALIAYNGGAERADKWLAAGRDDSVIPQESANYYKKVRAKADGVTGKLPAFPEANKFLKTRLAAQHGPEHIDGMVPQFQARLAGLISAAPPEIRDGLGIFSGRRTTERQRELWLASDRTGRDVARPGHSRHEHGDAADLSFNGKSLKDAPEHVRKWVHDNAATFGLKFPIGHEPWHIEMQETRGGKKFASDPRYAGLSVDEIRSLSNQAETAVNAQQVTAYASMKDAMNLGIATGAVLSEDQILGSALNDGDKATMLNKFRTERKDEIAAMETIASLNARTFEGDPYDTDTRKNIDNVAGILKKQATPEQYQLAAEEITRQSGIVPKDVVNAIRKGLESKNPAEVAAAAQQANRLSQIDPAALGRREGGKEAQNAADDFAFMVNDLNMTPEEAGKRIIDQNDPEKKRERKAIEPAAKEFIKEMQDFSLASEFDTWFGAEPEIGFSPGQALGIQAEFLAIAEDQFYAANGDPDIAQNRAVEQMKRLYGVTELTGRKVLMKHPPENYWPKFSIANAATSLSYPVQLENDIKEFSPNVDMGSVQLVTTPETDAMVKRGEMPGYAVIYKDENGVLQTIPGKLWKPDLGRLSETQEAFDAAEQNKAAASQKQGVEDARKAQTMWRDTVEGVPREVGGGMQNSPLMGDGGELAAQQVDAPKPSPSRPSIDTAPGGDAPLVDADFDKFQSRLLDASAAEKEREKKAAASREESAKEAYDKRHAEHERVRAALKAGKDPLTESERKKAEEAEAQAAAAKRDYERRRDQHKRIRELLKAGG